MRQFSFRLLHRTIVAKKELNKFRLVNDAACTFCSNPDSIEHTFLDCNVVTSFYSEAFSWFNQTYDTNFYLSNKQITLDDITPKTRLSDPIKRSLHLFVLYLKRYIYTCKSFEKKPNLLEFQKKIYYSGILKNVLFFNYWLCSLTREKRIIWTSPLNFSLPQSYL